MHPQETAIGRKVIAAACAAHVSRFVYHSARKGSGEDLEIDLCRNWHWMWSLFYYNVKHFGYFKAYCVTLNKLISSFYKFILATLLFNSKKRKINLYRILGLINAYQGKSSWLRPYMKK